MKIVITAASGNIGHRAAEQVVAAGAEAVLLSRQPSKLSALTARGASVQPVSSDDAQGILKASRGADALFWLAPPNPGATDLRDWYRQTATAAAQALRENHIPRVVCISSVGAGSGPDQGTISFAAEVEEIFQRATGNVLILRPGYFMENCLGQAESIRREGVLSFPYAADHDMPWISTDDIGDVAAKYLLDGGWAGQWTRNLLGPENLTLTEVAALLSRVSGRPVRYVQVSLEAVQHQLTAQGVNPTVRKQLGDLFRALGDPNGIYATARTPEAFTPTTFETFARNKLLPLLTTGG
ncbi:NmrA family NAD(P)-binding protein [Stigmatella sp. ncwal1]|uniref:NmrA family NAD(P)-binding protein n=1 Tax=Stigmatella ashevillensis TaxID=2995309 RepID=A0ABT5DG77_9BACT|nr:NmrA family NAD(P)-binding protein [Stigmatella ashevillena]MDC0712089.1 NmrA family NAD(P)-binding protein [Stigmatella ashevillena]